MPRLAVTHKVLHAAGGGLVLGVIVKGDGQACVGKVGGTRGAADLTCGPDQQVVTGGVTGHTVTRTHTRPAAAR
jgi:hypothetical protein